MEIKRFLYIVLAATLFFSSCEDLDRFPLTNVNTGIFFEQPNDLMEALTATYGVLRERTSQNVQLDGITNNCWARYYEIIALGNHTTTDGPHGGWWTTMYRGVQRANFVINNVEDANASAEQKTRIEGEAKFLRAYFYHRLMCLFGGVPLILETLSIDEYNTISRSPKETIFQQIISDLNAAIAVLPVTVDRSTEYGRATKGAALALKARVLLYESDWQGASDASRQVMDMAGQAGYALASDFHAMFVEAGEKSSEAVFDVQYLHGAVSGLANFYDYDSKNQIQPMQNLADEYEVIGPTDPDPVLFYVGRDPRLKATMRSIKDPEVYEHPTIQYHTPYIIFKGINVPLGQTYPPESGQNLMIIRYADILLMYAEAQNEVSGPDASVYDAINQVRARVNMPPITAGLSKELMRDKIRHERRVEFALEGLWYDDIRRWGVDFIISEMSKVTLDARANHILNSPETFMLFPIPQGERNINNNLEQNPGY